MCFTFVYKKIIIKMLYDYMLYNMVYSNCAIILTVGILIEKVLYWYTYKYIYMLEVILLNNHFLN